jgi:hypothetical protein
MPEPKKPASPIHYFNSSPAVIRLIVMKYARFPLSLLKVEDLLFERVRFWMLPVKARMTELRAQSRRRF